MKKKKRSSDEVTCPGKSYWSKICKKITGKRRQLNTKQSEQRKMK